MNAEQIMQEAAALEQQTIAHRRKLHTCPGIGFDLQETTDYVTAELIAMGYEPQQCGKAGIVALAGGKKPGKVFLMRADMDALPMAEASGEPFSADNGYMHACGHDMHTAMLLTAARILKAHEEDIEGTVKLMFQPAEETFSGADDMIQAGLMEHPKVDAGMMMHVDVGSVLPSGTIITMAPGVSSPACDGFEIRIQGKGCHGAQPQMGVDPITVAAHTVLALQEINAREVSMYDTMALTIGVIEAGNANNIIPDSALLKGSLRTFDEEQRAALKVRMQEIVTGMAALYRASATLTFIGGCPTVYNDTDTSKSLNKYAKELLGEQGALTTEEVAAITGAAVKAGGSDDFGFIAQLVPVTLLTIAAGQPEAGFTFPGHHPKVRFDESLLVNGAAVYAYTAMRWLEEHK